MTATAFTQNTTTLVQAHWPGISLDELNAKAAMQTRVDRKYIVDGLYAAAVLSNLPADASVLEINGERDFAYDSVYFDTENLVSYKLAATGRRNRYKIRTRSYVDTGATFLEVKTEGGHRQGTHPLPRRRPGLPQRRRPRLRRRIPTRPHRRPGHRL